VFEREIAGLADLYSINADGTGLVTLAAQPESEKLQGATATGRILFSRTVNGQSDLFSIRSDGTDLRVLADSPDNELILVP
jgi:hypothetical protein